MFLLLSETEVNRIFIGGVFIFLLFISWRVGNVSKLFTKRNLSGSYSSLVSKARGIAACPEAMITISVEGIIVAWNKGAEILFGYSEEEALAKNLLIIIPERYRAKHTEGLKRINDYGSSQSLGKSLDFEGLRKDGTEIPINMLLWQWKDETVFYFSAILRDATFSKNQFSVLENEVKLLETGEQISSSGTWDWDIVNDKVTYSKGFCAIFDIKDSLSSDSGTLLKKVYYVDRPTVEEKLKTAFETKEAYEVEYRILTSDGFIKKIHTKAITVLDEHGALQNITGVITDLGPVDRI